MSLCSNKLHRFKLGNYQEQAFQWLMITLKIWTLEYQKYFEIKDKIKTERFMWTEAKLGENLKYNDRTSALAIWTYRL